MKSWNIASNDSTWEILGQTTRTQGAVMAVAAGESEGGPENLHEDADQWLFVLDGAGEAIVKGYSIPLQKGVLVLIEAGDAHEIRGGEGGLRTLNFYGPPVEFEG